MCVDTGYFETYNRPNVRLVVDPRAPDRRDHRDRASAPARSTIELDAIVFATGFDAMTGALLAIDLRGRGGLALREKWAAGPRPASA